MPVPGFDAVIVGARCAGATTGYLLSKAGLRVLLVDQATFPSDKLSTHYLQPSGVAQLLKWGIISDETAFESPAIAELRCFVDGISIRGRIKDARGGAVRGYCTRRTVLDQKLVQAARKAGVEVWQGARVLDVIQDGPTAVGVRLRMKGSVCSVYAKITIGADGVRSTTARAVGAQTIGGVEESQTCVFYSYWSGIPIEWGELHTSEGVGVGAYPTNDGLTCIAVALPVGRFDEFRADVDGLVHDSLAQLGVDYLGREGVQRAERYRGTRDVPQFFRDCEGPGWALVGDASHHKDPITGQGMTDAICDAEILSKTVLEELSAYGHFTGTGQYQSRRNSRSAESHRATRRIAELKGLPASQSRFFDTIAASEELSESYVSMVSGLTSGAEFLRICTVAGAVSASLDGVGEVV